ncbi:MAG: hypothetical protein IPL52_05205 [Flavobacteriales bacterium]|nr:hypothetical protein [Flavobacteriales bacterium]
MGLIGTLKVSCRKASELIERRELRPLSAMERIGLRLHLGICDGCRAYEKQSVVIDRWLDEKRDGCAKPACTELQEAVLKRCR